MDMKLLLDRKELKKQLAKGGNKPSKDSEAGVNESKPLQNRSLGEVTQSSRSSNHSSPQSPNNKTSPSAARFYDPRALLNPRGTSKQTSRKTPESSHSAPSMISDGAEAPTTLAMSPSSASFHHSDPPMSKNLLAAHYGIEDRTEPPQKRVKLSVNGSEDEKHASNSRHAVHHTNNGVVGEYLKPKPVDQVPPEMLNNAVVDLTNDDDVDDRGNEIEVTGSRNVLDEEVCLGALHGWAQAHLTPKPKLKSNYETPGMWPLITCSLKRLQDIKTTRIDIIDLHGADFGRLDPETALPLSQAMDGLRGLRTQPRLMPRKKLEGQWPHQATSERIHVRVNVYVRKGDVEKLGRLFGLHNKWFQTPLNPDKSIPIMNPHQSKKVAQAISLSRPRGNLLSDTRTLEEATSEVTKLFDHFAGQSLVLEETEAPPGIRTQLLSHQKQALTFMLAHEKRRTFGEKEEENSSLWREKLTSKGRAVYEDPVSGFRTDEEPEQVFGGLLADVMGLGKTLEALALIANTSEEAATFARAKFVRSGESEAELMCNSKATVIVCPTSTVQNWENQIKEHVDNDTLSYYVYHGPNRIRNAYELGKYDIVVTTYGTITSDHSKKTHTTTAAPLKQIKWFRIVLDEAHTIREQRTAQSEAANKIWAQRRWCLTGTPIQNRIDDLGALTHFLRLYPYDNVARFNQYIRGPALAGDPAFLFKLRIFVDSFTLRRLRDKIDLPQRENVVQDLDFTKAEEQMHEIFKKRARIEVERLAESKEKKSGVSHHVLQAIMTLRLICAHGRDLLKEKDLGVLKGITEEEPIDIDEEETYRTINQRAAYETLKLKADAEVDFCHQCDKRLCGDTPNAEVDDEEKGARCFVLPCLDTVCADCFSPYRSSFWETADSAEPLDCPFCGLQIAAQYVGIKGSVTETLESLPDEDLETKVKKEELEKDSYGGPSTKTKALLKDIEYMKRDSEVYTNRGEPPLKCVVFSEFTSNLNLIERDLAAQGHTFVRIDGTMSLNKRKQVLEALAGDDSVTILLASIKAAGQGLNLTAASRAFIMEPMWNPAAEAQAVDRIYRIGQKRDVIVKRYLIKDSIEGKIVELQKKKQQLADVTMSRNHQQLSKKEIREQHMKDIVKLFK